MIMYVFIITFFLVIVATGIIMLVLVYQKKQQAYVNEKQQLKTAFEREILESKLELQEQTFKNISQEIHDNIGQVLSLVKLNINTMDCGQPVALQSKIDNSKTLITKAIQDLRDLSRSLNTDYVLELGLIRAIEYELEIIQKTETYTIQFDTSGNRYRLLPQEELIFFRIVQEVLHNIIKHAKATKINIEALFETEKFSLVINDNGSGFDASQLNSRNYSGFGLGFRNMYNRAHMIHADFNLKSTLEEGTTVVLTLPVPIQKL